MRPISRVRRALVSRRHPDYRTSCILELGGEKIAETMSASRPDPSTYKPSSMINSSLEALSCLTLRFQVLRSVWFCPARAHSALGIYDAQCITLFLAGPPKWTRSSAPLFRSALSPPFAAKRKQWSILAPRQAPNKVPLLCSAPWGSECSVGTTAGGRVRWQVSCHLLSRRQPPASERRAAHTCHWGIKITPFDFYLHICPLFWEIQGWSSTLRIYQT